MSRSPWTRAGAAAEIAIRHRVEHRVDPPDPFLAAPRQQAYDGDREQHRGLDWRTGPVSLTLFALFVGYLALSRSDVEPERG